MLFWLYKSYNYVVACLTCILFHGPNKITQSACLSVLLDLVVAMLLQTLCHISSSLTFHMIWGRRNSFGFLMLSCPLHPPPSAPASFHLVCCHPLCLFPGTSASAIHLSTCPSSPLLLTCPYHFSLSSVIFFGTDATSVLPILTHNHLWSYLSPWLHASTSTSS